MLESSYVPTSNTKAYKIDIRRHRYPTLPLTRIQRPENLRRQRPHVRVRHSTTNPSSIALSLYMRTHALSDEFHPAVHIVYGAMRGCMGVVQRA
jgi:hypothetical protein